MIYRYLVFVCDSCNRQWSVSWFSEKFILGEEQFIVCPFCGHVAKGALTDDMLVIKEDDSEPT